MWRGSLSPSGRSQDAMQSGGGGGDIGGVQLSLSGRRKDAMQSGDLSDRYS